MYLTKSWFRFRLTDYLAPIKFLSALFMAVSGRDAASLTAPRQLHEEDKIKFQVPRKRSHRIFIGIFFTLSIVVSGILLDGLLVKLPKGPNWTSPTERIGVIHVHTRASDGSGTVSDVMAAAQQANLSFIAITDHNVAMTENDLAEDPPDLPIISGEELSTSAGHFLALGIPASWVAPKTKNDQTLLAAAHAAGAFTVLAHPFHPHTPWTDWKTADFDGIEIWNEDSAWRQNNVFDLMVSLLLYGENTQLSLERLARTPDENFAKWDKLLAQRPVAGICGADTHARVSLGYAGILRFPGYVPSFRVAREHVLLPQSAGGGDPGRASGGEILDALRRGHSFCALDALYPASGFSFRVLSGGDSGGPGDFLPWTGAGKIQISVPSGKNRPLIKVFHDGREIIEEQSWTVDAPITGPGRYRTEVFLRQAGLTGWGRWTLWAFTNPVYVTAQ